MDFGQNQQDFHNRNPYQQYMDNQKEPQQDKRSQAMTTAAVILSVAAVSAICCTYLSIICGSLGITFALLSKGGEQTMSQNAKTALSVSVLAVGMAWMLLAGSIIMLIVRYGSLEAVWNAYMELAESRIQQGL